VLIAPIAAVFLLKEKFSRKDIALTLVGIVGIALINPFSGEENLGSVLALVAGTSYALMTVFARRVDKHHSIGDVAWFMGFASLFLLPFGLEKGLLNIPALDWPVLVGLGVVSTGLGYLFYNIALGKLRVHIISMLDLVITTIGTILLSVIYFQEGLSPLTLVGGIVVAAIGILFAVESHLLDEGLKLPSHASLGYVPHPSKGKSRRARRRAPARK
jgi:drug/metabolite transporter (DMT)-like permease